MLTYSLLNRHPASLRLHPLHPRGCKISSALRSLAADVA
jgi:hypothetical protein